jgi:hypothetical protein
MEKIGISYLPNLTTNQVNAASAKVDSLDLTNVRLYCQQQHGWDSTYASEVEEGYRRYLSLHLLFPETRFVATKDVDLFWHTHILHTRQYEADSEAVFGKMFHHDPVLVSETADLRPYADDFSKMLNVMQSVFGGIKGTRYSFEQLSKRNGELFVNQAVCGNNGEPLVHSKKSILHADQAVCGNNGDTLIHDRASKTQKTVCYPC